MKKVLNIFIIVLVYFFALGISVKAESMNCKYKYEYNASAGVKNEIEIDYDGNTINVKKDGFKTNSIPDITTTHIRNNNGDLACPFFGVKVTIGSGRDASSLYQVDWQVNNVPEGYDRVEASYSSIDNNRSDNNNNNNQNIISSCEYKTNSGEKVFSFEITENNEGINYTLLGQYSSYKLGIGAIKNHVYDNNCPLYFSASCYASTKTCSVAPSSESGDWIYTGSGNNADGNNEDLITIYIQYNSPSSPRINILNLNGYIATLNATSITISNMADVTNRIADAKYPTYIIKTEDGYAFYDTKEEVNGKKIEEIYMNANYLIQIVNLLDQEEEYTTCEDLFGDSFLTFMDNYIFTVIRIGVAILLIVLTTFDFAKVVFVDDKEGIQKAFHNFKIRAIAAVLIFLTPTILIIIANLIGAPDSVSDCMKTVRNMGEVVSSEVDN